MRTYREIFSELDVILYNPSQRNKFQIRNSSRISKLINTRTSFTKIVTRERGLHAYCAYKSILFANPATRLLKRAQEEKHQRNLTKFYQKFEYIRILDFEKMFTVSTRNHNFVQPIRRIIKRTQIDEYEESRATLWWFSSQRGFLDPEIGRRPSKKEGQSERELHMTSVKRLVQVPPCVNCRSQGGIIHPYKV